MAFGLLGLLANDLLRQWNSFRVAFRVEEGVAAFSKRSKSLGGPLGGLL
jgi:hypothetical protein